MCNAQTGCRLKEKLTQRDFFECAYIHRHLDQDVYRDSKTRLESLRNGLAYDDEGVDRAFNNWIDGLEWDETEPQKRIGDIHIGGDILPEFKS